MRVKTLDRPQYVTAALSRPMLRRLDRFADDHLSNRAEAVRELLQRALDRDEGKDDNL